MLMLDAVDKTYPNGVHALERFSATINVGEIVAIIGGSGSPCRALALVEHD